jgi:hypothetical protein
MEQIKIEVLNEHLRYELDMLDEATAYIASQEFADACGVRDDVLRGSKETRQSKPFGPTHAASSSFSIAARKAMLL